MNIEFQGQLTRATVTGGRPRGRLGSKWRPAYSAAMASTMRIHLDHLVETMQDLVSRPGRSEPGQPPGLQTGRLRDSIKLYDRSSFGGPGSFGEVKFQIAVEAPYAQYLEWGTKRMAPRPFMMKTYNAFRNVEAKTMVKGMMEALGRIFIGWIS